MLVIFHDYESPLPPQDFGSRKKTSRSEHVEAAFAASRRSKALCSELFLRVEEVTKRCAAVKLKLSRVIEAVTCSMPRQKQICVVDIDWVGTTAVVTQQFTARICLLVNRIHLHDGIPDVVDILSNVVDFLLAMRFNGFFEADTALMISSTVDNIIRGINERNFRSGFIALIFKKGNDDVTERRRTADHRTAKPRIDSEDLDELVRVCM